MTTTRQQIEAALADLVSRVGDRERSIYDLFDDHPNLLFAGTEVYDIYAGQAELEPFLARLHESPVTARWEWDRIDFDQQGDLIWFFAAGQRIFNLAGVLESAPLRLSGVLVEREAGLRWRYFHASVPRI